MRIAVRATAVVAVAGCALALTAAPAAATGGGWHGDRDPVKVIASGLNGPFELSEGPGNSLYVTESGGAPGSGQVTSVDLWRGRTQPVITGLTNATGAVQVDGKFAITTGEGGGPPEEEMALTALRAPIDASGVTQASAVLVAKRNGDVRPFADLLAFELANNPDGQTQFAPDGVTPLEALSNPFFVLEDHSRKGFVFVADAGANAVLQVDRKGNVTPFFVPPVITTGVCAGAPNNDPEHAGCDPVPTGLAYGPRNTLYISGLSAEAPGEGRVYVLNARTGELLRTITGLTSPTGIAVDGRGTVYVSNVIEGAPLEGPPPEGFDPATIGEITKISPSGKRSVAQVTMPSGLLWENGKLYASAWSVAGLFLGIADAGQVVEVRDSAFVPVS